MKRPRYLSAAAIVCLVTLSALFTPAFARQTARSQYEVSNDKGQTATVETSASKDAVIVSIYRQGQTTHHYRAYPQASTITVQVGRQTVFTYYIKLGRIDVNSFGVAQGRPGAGSFSVELAKVKGPERRQRSDIEAVRRQFEDDMHILRAVRGYDKTADVLLAELAYVVLTYDDSIMDGNPSTSLSVHELTLASLPDK